MGGSAVGETVGADAVGAGRTGRRGWQRPALGRRIATTWVGLLTIASIASAQGVAPVGAAEPMSDAGSDPSAAAGASGAPRTWHATAFVSGMGGYRIIQYWSEGPAMRAETVIGGHPIATLVQGDRYAVVDRMTGKALEVVRSPRALAEDAARLRPFAFEYDEIRSAGGEKVEETTLSGVEVEVWRVTNDLGRRTVWRAREEPRVPLRVETFVRATSQTIKIDYSGWGFDLEIPESFYALPPGLEVERLSYDAFLAKSRVGPVGPAPILYPDLLHGAKP
ncbi:MAG: hypothetical protein R3F35_19445 [Myxococcota bacterium]